MKSQVEITTFGDGTAQIIVDGKDVSYSVKAFNLDAKWASVATLTLEYNCYEQTTIEGEMDVVHICPKKAR